MMMDLIKINCLGGKMDYIYTDFILKNIPRVLTQIDRDEHSQTYGSCDRNHWHLKIRDFTSAILQQTGLSLAIVYKYDFNGNIYFKNESIKKWAKATVYYWAKIQLKDGSFNEYYPWEHGFPPTAFSLYAACEIYKLLEMKDDYLENKFIKTCKYLNTHIEEKAFNQEIASITAMYNAYTILNEKWILEGVNRKLNRILAMQNTEGWFPEYGGADIGYLSVSFDMLAEYYWLSKNESVIKPLNKILNFIQYFIHIDGTVGGEYGSRNTTYFLPNGLQVLSTLGNAKAETIIKKLYSKSKEYNFFMDSVDDRYFSHYVLHSFLRAQEKRDISYTNGNESLPYQFNHEKFFNESGLVSFKNDEYIVILSLGKGGLIKVFFNKKEVYIDCGYRINYGNGEVGTTNWLDPEYRIEYQDEEYRVSGVMNKVKLKVSTPFMHIGLRGASFLFGNKIIGFLKNKIIFVNNHNNVSFNRKIKLNRNYIEIYDYFDSLENFTLEHASNMSLRHVASGKFFMTSDLLAKNDIKYKDIKKIKIKTCIFIDGGNIGVTCERLDEPEI